MAHVTRRALGALTFAAAATQAHAKAPAVETPWPDGTETVARIRGGKLSALEAARGAIQRTRDPGALQRTAPEVSDADDPDADGGPPVRAHRRALVLGPDLDLGDLACVVLHPIEQLGAEFLVRGPSGERTIAA